MHYRPFQSEDLPHLVEICLRTGDHGGDASDTCSHPQLLGDYYAVPYVVREPGLCLVLADAIGPCGYILGTADTRAFFAWFNATWLPAIRPKYHTIVPAQGASDAWLLELIAREAEVPDFVDEFPAHLHIDLLPRAQGGGWGRRLFEAWAAVATGRGIRGLHLGVAKANARAIGFYERLGLKSIDETAGTRIYGCHLGEASRQSPQTPC